MDYCYVCGRDTDPHLMMICDMCDYMVAHTYCCGFGEVFPDDWMCRECEEIMDDDSDDDHEIIEYLSNEEESDDSSYIEDDSSSENANRGVRIGLI